MASSSEEDHNWIENRKEPGGEEFQTLGRERPEDKEEKLERWKEAASQDWTFLHGEPRKDLANRINHEMGPEKDKDVVELAAGEIQHVEESDAVDFSEEMLEKNPAENRLKFDLDDLSEGKELPYEDDSQDSVVMTYGINYIEDQEAVIEEASRITKEDGKILLFGQKGAGLESYPKHGYSPKKLKKKLEEEGMNVHTEEIPRAEKEFDRSFGTLVEAGKDLDPEEADGRSKVFDRQSKKRKKNRKKRFKKHSEVKEDDPDQYQSTTDYWRVKGVLDDIEKEFEEEKVEAEIKPKDNVLGNARSDKENQTAPTPSKVNFSVVTKQELPESKEEDIESKVEEKMKEEFEDYGNYEKELRAWREKDRGPSFKGVLSKEDYEEEREEDRGFM